MVLVEAKVMDSTHLELSRPISFGRGKMILVAMTESGEQDGDRQQWIDGSAASLQAAYGDSEPNYTPAMVRERNPDYGACED